jgi:hypothetical protein
MSSLAPGSPLDDVGNGALRDLVLPGKFGVRGRSRGVRGANGADLIPGQERPSVPVSVRPSPFPRAVLMIVVVRAKPEVSRVHAPGIVPVWAVVKHLQAIGDRAIGQQPRETVCKNIAPLHAELTVASPKATPHPQPTRIRSTRPVHLRPKPFDVLWGKILAHREPPFLVPRRRLLQQCAGFPLPQLSQSSAGFGGA